MIIQLVKGDITQIKVDAIVNAANEKLIGGGGVDGAIHRVGGPDIMKECDVIRKNHGGCPTGKAVLTTAGNLPAKKIIHTVGPIWKGGELNEPDLLRSAYFTSLTMANENRLSVISFPNISTGVYGFPKHGAAHIAISTVKNFAPQKLIIKRVIFVCFDYESYEIYYSILNNG